MKVDKILRRFLPKRLIIYLCSNDQRIILMDTNCVYFVVVTGFVYKYCLDKFVSSKV